MPLTVRAFDREAVLPPHSLLKPHLPAGPLDLEIGCGVGWHPIKYAQANPNRTLIAIEHTRAKFDGFRRRADRHELPNLLPIHADAIRWVTHALPESSVDRIFVLYPNPEPQAANKRWFRMPFMHELLTKLKPQGTIELATNIATYKDEAKMYASEVWNLELADEHTVTENPRTHFEKKYLLRGETCFDVTFRKP